MVNKHRYKLFFLGQDKCGDDEVRQLYHVTKATFEKNNLVELVSVKAEWAHVVEQDKLRRRSALSRTRSGPDISHSLFANVIEFNHNISDSVVSSQDISDRVTLDLDCEPYSASGDIQLSIVISSMSAKLIVVPRQLGSSITLQLAAQEALTNSIDKTSTFPFINFADIPLIIESFEAVSVFYVQAEVGIS